MTFSKNKTRAPIVPVVMLRYAKVVVVDGIRGRVVVVDGIRGRNQWHVFVPISHRRVVLFPKTLWSSIIGGVEGVICSCGACFRCCCCFGRLWSTGSGRVGT